MLIFWYNGFMKKNAYTLIELVVALTIVLLVSGSIIAFVNIGGNQYAQRRTAQLLAFNLRELQSMALSPKKHNDSYPICFYGLKISSPKEYFTYYAYDTNTINPCASLSYQYGSGLTNFYVMEKFKVEPRIFFVTSGEDVVFVPPDSSVYFNGTKVNPGTQKLVNQIKSVQNTSLGTLDVYINAFGNVYFNR